MHVDDHHRDALVLRGVRIGAHRRESLAGLVRTAGPHLLAVDEPPALGADGAGLDARGVRTGSGVTEQLTPDELLPKRRRDEPLHLLRGRVLDDREQVPAGDAVRRPLDAGGRELLLDDELLDGAGVAAPRPGPVRHHVTGLDHRVTASVGVEVLHARDELAYLAPELLRLRRQVDAALTYDAPAGEVGRLGGGVVAVEQRTQHGRPA